MHDTHLDSPDEAHNDVKLKTLVFSGGGLLGYSHIGFMRALREHDLLDAQLDLYGTSIGSLVALMVAIGCTTDAMIAHFDKLNSGILNIQNFSTLNAMHGLDNGEYYIAFLIDVLRSMGFAHDTTFRTLHAKTGMQLNVCQTNLTTGDSELWSHVTHPTHRVVDAIRASCSVPILVSPYIDERGHVFIDGGVMCNYPYPIGVTQRTTLGINIKTYQIGNPIQTMDAMLMSIVGCVLRRQLTAEQRKTTVEVDGTVSSDWDISMDKRKELESTGYKETMAFLTQFPFCLERK